MHHIDGWDSAFSKKLHIADHPTKVFLPQRNMFKFNPQTKDVWTQIKSTALISSLTHLLSTHVLHDYGCATGGRKMRQTCRVALEGRFYPQWDPLWPTTGQVRLHSHALRLNFLATSTLRQDGFLVTSGPKSPPALFGPVKYTELSVSDWTPSKTAGGPDSRQCFSAPARHIGPGRFRHIATQNAALPALATLPTAADVTTDAAAEPDDDTHRWGIPR